MYYYDLHLAGSNNAISRNGATTTTPTIIQRSGINLPRLNAAYLSQIKTNEPPKIAFRPSKYLNKTKNLK